MNFSINIQREDSVVRWTMHKEEKPIIKKVKAKVKAKYNQHHVIICDFCTVHAHNIRKNMVKYYQS